MKNAIILIVLCISFLQSRAQLDDLLMLDDMLEEIKENTIEDFKKNNSSYILSLLGKQITNTDVQQYLNNTNHDFKEVTNGFESKKLGLRLNYLESDKALIKATFYNKTSSGFNKYANDLPFGLSFENYQGNDEIKFTKGFGTTYNADYKDYKIYTYLPFGQKTAEYISFTRKEKEEKSLQTIGL